MYTNPALKKLGFAKDDRVAIIHADDIGMCHATLQAIEDLIDFGLVSSCSVMVPCPWFPQTASFCRQHPEVDTGVHLTLTSEWGGYHWGPVSTTNINSGLIDEQGYFHSRRHIVQANAEPEVVQRELQVQVDGALDEGIDVTHIDSHMLSVYHPDYLDGYIEVAEDHDVPPLILRLEPVIWRTLKFEHELADFLTRFMRSSQLSGLPYMDNFVMLPLDQSEERVDLVKKNFLSLPKGCLTLYIIHPAIDTPELRAIAPDWQSRVADYLAFTSTELRNYIRASGVQVIGYRELRDLLRADKKSEEKL